MTITETVRDPKRLFSKEMKIIQITGVTQADAQELAQRLRHLFFEHGYDSNYQVYVSGEKVGGVTIMGNDHWESPDDCHHFVEGFQLGMSMSGVDVTPGP
ncbi:MAG: hypothetical protein KBH45_15175 [Verrucomicrobia bacterium]|nr:hypothetical protein [Verrucomicrobiota bacterium]